MLRRGTILFVLLTGAGLFLAGCVGVSHGSPQSLLLLVLSVFLLIGCSQAIHISPKEPTETTDETNRETATSPDERTTSPDDAGTQPEGNWERCCQNGTITTCFCPANMACNYGWFADCGNGTCVNGPAASCHEGEVPDGGEPAPDTRTEPAPEIRPEPTPEPRPETRPEPKPETRPEPVVETQPERKGRWESCCKDGKISTCFCPEGLACNYGWYKPCANQTCVAPNQNCP